MKLGSTLRNSINFYLSWGQLGSDLKELLWIITNSNIF